MTLQDRVQLEWHSRVKLLFGDMREVEPPELMGQVDILVSELLGSFGDNEVSPECLDGAARFLKRTFMPQWLALYKLIVYSDCSERNIDT